MLAKVRHYISKDDLKSLYFAIFSSHLTYGSQIWGQVINSFNQRIFKLQNRALRIITFSDLRADSAPLYRDLKILKLDDHISLQNCLFVHDALHKISPVCFHDYFTYTSEVHTFSTKSVTYGNLFVKHSGTIRYGINSIINKCVHNWNILSRILKLDFFTISRFSFRSVIHKHYIECY